MEMYKDAIDILVDSSSSNYFKESHNVQTILEDVNSPVTRKYQEKLYNSVISKAHIDFDDIPKSNGNIRNYSGYNTMMETLQDVLSLAKEQKANNVEDYTNIVLKAIDNIAGLSSTYQKGFDTHTEYVALEYDIYVYFCIEATTALIYSFVDVMRDPEKQMLQIQIKNTKLRADAFYFDQLKKFNLVQDHHGIDYRKMLENMCDKGKSNFTGATVIGIAAVTTAAMSIVPITREIIYQIYNFRGKLSNNLALQAKFLELNKTCVENNDQFDQAKKDKIIKKQTDLAKKLRKLSDDIKIKSKKSIEDSQRNLKKDNKNITIDNIKDEISNSPLELF